MQWLGEIIHLCSKFTVSDGNMIDMTHMTDITTWAEEHGRRRRAPEKQMRQLVSIALHLAMPCRDVRIQGDFPGLV